MTALPKIRKFLTGIAVVMLLAAAGFGIYTMWFLSGAEQTFGTIVELKKQTSDGGAVFRPVFEFTDKNGNRQLVESGVGSNPAAFAVGEAVSVYYLPANPKTAKIGSFLQIWFFPTLFTIIGIGIAVISMLLGLVRPRAG